MEMGGFLKLAEDKGQAVHPRLSQCQLSKEDELVRKNASRGGNKVTLPKDVLEPLPSAGVSFCLQVSSTSQKVMGLRSWLAPVGKPGWEKPCTSKAKYDCQCCQLHSRQDSCRLPCEQRFRQGDHWESLAKEHHVPLTSGARKAEWLPC